MGHYKMKTLSVIIPLYNSAQWIEKCLYSVLNQDVPEEQMEIVCVNDGSPDDSADIARKIGKKHTSIIVIDQTNQGPSGARNTGMRHATGKYLVFVDPDDFVEPNVFGLLVNKMESEQLDMLRFNYQVVDEQYQLVEKRPFEKSFDYSSKLMTGAEFLATRLDIACNIWRYMYRTEIIIKNDLWCFAYGDYDDTPWLPQVLLKVLRMNCCAVVAYDYLVRQDSLVRVKTPDIQHRKIDGTFQLINFLCHFKNKLSRGEMDVPDKWRRGIIDWYGGMLSHTIISYCTILSTYFYAQRDECLSKLRGLHIFPLSVKRIPRKEQELVCIINLSPRLYIWLLHLKNS